jgi:chemotaxis protein MotB
LRIPWGLAAAATMAALFFLMLWLQDKSNQQREIGSLRTKLAASASDLARALADSQTNQDLIASLKNQVSDLQKEKEFAGQMARNLEDEMRSDLESKDVTISKLQGKLTVTILDRVMFDSGEAVLKPDGAQVMQKIAALLAEHPTLKIHVIGHTDNVPIRPNAQNRLASNWELSTARALAAVHFLTEKAGVDPRRVGAVGYGEFRPIAENSTPDGRAKNRRIAITILSDELAGADTPPPLSNAATNTPPPGL